MNKDEVKEFLKTRKDGSLFHRESQSLEFKEQFNFAGLADYLKDFAAFANGSGGFIVFGVTDAPRRLVGLSKKSKEQFDNIDPAIISQHLSKIFSPEIYWEQNLYSIKRKRFGVFFIRKCSDKPVIAKEDAGNEQQIKEGEIYYRYGGSTKKIGYSELQNIIQEKLEHQNDQWKNLMSKIATTTPANAAVLDTKSGIIEKGKNQTLVIDESLLKKINFVSDDGSSGGDALRIIGDVYPVQSIQKVKKQKLTDAYPYSATELYAEIKKRIPSAKINRVWDIIKENNIKENPAYSVYNFRNKSQEEKYKKTGEVPQVPSIYNLEAIDFIEKVLRNEMNK